MYNYYFAIATKSFLLNQEPIEEILRERVNFYKNSGREIDFWFVLDPEFPHLIDKVNNLEKVRKPLAAIVSLDQEFIKWLKLRVVFIKVGNFKSSSIFLSSFNLNV
uniref:Ycf54 n=1 Tax=Polysiphonia sertularioides TaxID=945028 RepID=A0A1Z1MGB1_9FLOR|nr:hypothetical protein [Polysiphonia sertularioides]